MFQAYEQRLPAEAVVELAERSAVTPGRFPYDCPGEQLLDVSWHWTANSVQGWWQNFLMRPSLDGAVKVGAGAPFLYKQTTYVSAGVSVGYLTTCVSLG